VVHQQRRQLHRPRTHRKSEVTPACASVREWRLSYRRSFALEIGLEYDFAVRSGLVRALLVVGSLTVAGVLTESAQSGTSELLVHFVTADRNAECEMVDPETTIGNVECVLHSNGYTTRGDLDNHGLTARPHPHWFVDYSHPASGGLSRREVHGPVPARTLQTGRTLTVGNFRCSSRVAGLTCTSLRSRHGFFLSRTKQRTF
jgi:hypothetical protein